MSDSSHLYVYIVLLISCRIASQRPATHICLLSPWTMRVSMLWYVWFQHIYIYILGMTRACLPANEDGLPPKSPVSFVVLDIHGTCVSSPSSKSIPCPWRVGICHQPVWGPPRNPCGNHASKKIPGSRSPVAPNSDRCGSRGISCTRCWMTVQQFEKCF